MQAATTRPEDHRDRRGAGVVSHAGSRLLADVADRTALSGELADALVGLRRSRARHDPGRVLVDLAVAVADGATTISDIAVLADQQVLVGAVVSDSTCWRLLNEIDGRTLGAVAAARARAREVVWAQHGEAHGRAFPSARVAGQDLRQAGQDVLVIDLDASIVTCHSEKQDAAPTFKGSFGYHPMLAFCDNTGEFLAAQLRRGNAGANSAADHISVLDQALAQIPDAHRHGRPVLIRTDTAGCTKAFLAHIRNQRDRAVSCELSVGRAVTGREHAAIAAVPKRVWADAVDTDGGHRDGAGLAEITGLLPAKALASFPVGTRVIVRRERPHPGRATGPDRNPRRMALHLLRHRHQRRPALLPRCRHRAHARVEDRIRTSTDTGLGHFPSRTFAINAAWLTVVMLAVDLIAWTRHLVLDGHLASAEPKTLRCRLLHVAARITHGPAPRLAAHPAVLALGARTRAGLRPTARTVRPRRLTPHPQPEDQRSTRHNRRPDDPARPRIGNRHDHEREISYARHESPRLG